MNNVNLGDKKILFIITQSEMGGAQRFLSAAAPWFAKQKYEVIVAAGQGDNALISNIKSQNANINIKFQILKHLKRAPCLAEAGLAILEIRRLIKKEQPEALFLCSTMAGLLASLAMFSNPITKHSKARKINQKRLMFSNPITKHQLPATSYKLQTIYRIGGWAFNDPRPCWQKKLIISLERLTARFKHKIIVNSQYDFDCALKHKIAKPPKLVKIYNGIDSSKLQFLPREQAEEFLFSILGRRTSSGSPTSVVGTIANHYKTKGLEYLIEAASLLPKENCQFMIIGDGPERKKLEQKISKYQLENKVFLLGRIKEAYKYLKAFDVFVLPSLKEGFPWAVLEAMAAELPIIATSVGAVPEIIENKKSGLVVKPGNTQELAESIKMLVNNPLLQQQLAQNTKQKLNQFSEAKMLHQTLNLL